MEVTEKGICRLSIVPVRTKAAHRSEQATQLLFGDHYEVLEAKADWRRIRIHFDGYQGWIHQNQHYPISHEYYEAINHADYKICTDHSANIFFKKDYIHIVLGSVLPITTNELFSMEERLAFTGKAKSMHQKKDFTFMREIAMKYLHAPYLWGGKTPYGTDCSGFVQQVFKICGYPLLRDSPQQALQGKPVKSMAKARPGDLAFFANKASKIEHVGLLLEHNQIIHAHGKVRIDTLDETGICQNDTQEYSHSLSHFRRFIKFIA